MNYNKYFIKYSLYGKIGKKQSKRVFAIRCATWLKQVSPKPTLYATLRRAGLTCKVKQCHSKNECLRTGMSLLYADGICHESQVERKYHKRKECHIYFF